MEVSLLSHETLHYQGHLILCQLFMFDDFDCIFLSGVRLQLGLEDCRELSSADFLHKIIHFFHL